MKEFTTFAHFNEKLLYILLNWLVKKEIFIFATFIWPENKLFVVWQM